ncbi:MAG: recombinase family protein [Dehalococcoidia bacterium]|nr:recombinase family protein [Dehalococcoidia bacterium]
MVTQSVRRVATYERVSSEDQKQRETIKTQTDEIARRLAGDADVLFVKRYPDDGVSGTVPFALRPGGRQLLADAARGLFDQVWVYKIDRLGRDDVDPLVVWKQLEALGVSVYSVTEGVSDPFMYHIRVAVAAQERRDFLKRTADGMNRAASEGRYTGGIAPLGYKVVGEKQDARLVKSDTLIWADLTGEDLVRQVYDWLALDDRSCRWIADELNSRGVPTVYERDGRGIRGKRTQGKWRAGRIRNLVINPVYKGKLSYGRRTKRTREVIVADCEPLVSPAVWHAAQETLARNRISAKNTNRVYLLRSKIVCGACGLKFCGSFNNRSTWYRCNGRLTDRGPIEGRCPSKMVKGEFLEPLVWADIEQFLRNPGDLLEELADEAGLDSAPAIAEAERATLGTALAGLLDERDLTLDLYTRRHVTAEELDQRLDAIKAQQAELERRLAALEPAPSAHDEPLPADLLEQLRSRLDEGFDDATKHEIISALVRQITVYPTEVDGRRSSRIVIEYRFVVSVSRGTGSSR